MSIETPERITRIRPNPKPERASNLAELAAALESKARVLECAHDARVGFCGAYVADMRALHAAHESGDFGPGASWLTRVEVEAGQAYLRALDAWTSGETWGVPAPWRAVFARSRRGLEPREELRLGATAHIGYDIPLAIARAATTVDRDAMRAAFDRATLLLAASGPRARLLRVLPRRDGFSIARLRARAFDDGMALADARDDASLRAAFSRVESRVLLSVAAR